MQPAHQFPEAIIIAASNPPHVIHAMGKKSELSDEDFIAFLQSIGGIPKALEQEKELLLYLLPLLRKDYKAVDTVTIEEELIQIPTHILYGKKDNLAPPQKLMEWQQYCRESIVYHELSSGHMFVKEQPHAAASVLETIIQNERDKRMGKQKVASHFVASDFDTVNIGEKDLKQLFT